MNSGASNEGGHFASSPSELVQSLARVAVGPDGTIYTSDPEGNRVAGERDGKRVLELTRLARPLGVAVFKDRLYVGNAGRHNVEVYDLTEHALVDVLEPVDMPNAIAVAPDGVVYVADSTRDVVRVFEDGKKTMDIGGSGSGDGQLRFPSAVTVDAERVVVGDQINHRLQVFDSAGNFVRTIGEEATSANQGSCGRFTRVQGVALHGDDIFALDSYHGHVAVFSGEGVCRGLMGQMGDCPTCVGLALDVAVKRDGTVLLTDPDHKRLVALREEALR